MSSENLDIVRSIYAAWERGDFDSADWAHPTIEVVYADGPDPGTWTGTGGMTEGMRRFLSAWREWRIAADEYREFDEERVFVLVNLKAVGKTSGLEVPAELAKGANLFTIHSGKVTRMVLYFNRDRALADLGLEE